MFHIDVTDAIRNLRAALCPPSARKPDGSYDGIVFNFRLELYSKHVSERTYFSVLLYGNTTVFIREGENADAPWKFQGNHDQCWHSDGLRRLRDLYFEMADKVDPDVAPRTLSQNCYFGTDVFRLVRVKDQIDLDDPNRYRRKLVEVAPR